MLLPLAGFVAGMHHVVTGPDHLAAVAPLAVSDRRAAWRGGMTWALGHAGGVSIIALVALALREVIPFEAEWLSGWSERLVGVVLVAIGLWGLKRAFSHRLHTHVHEHDGQRHVHVHVHEESGAHHPRESTGHHHHSHAALAVGTLHGLAGGSHFLGVIPALVAPGPSDAILYLVCYALGTVTSMVAFASILGFLAHRAGEAGMRWARGLMTLSSAAAIVVGAFWLATSFRGAV